MPASVLSIGPSTQSVLYGAYGGPSRAVLLLPAVPPRLLCAELIQKRCFPFRRSAEVYRAETEVQPLASSLTTKINGIDCRLIGIEARLVALVFKRNSLDARQNELASRIDSN